MATSTQEFKILVADDSPLYRKLVEETLGREQYVVCFAKNGRQASDLLAEHHPALVITDWEMPDLTGIELCGQIRGDRSSYTYIILLTSLPNRRAVENWAMRQLSGAARHGFPFWVVMADLDAFKRVNDTYGHEAGDVVLKRFADVLRANTRTSNICGRIGGEEFVVVITHVEKPNIQIAIDRIRRELEAEQFNFEGRILGITASFGVSGFQRGAVPDFSQVLREADIALYAAKRAGRNRVEFAEAFNAERQ